jgi:hypothetical protein
MNRVKVWILVATVAVLASVVTLLVCMHVMRDALRRQAQASANEITDDIQLNLERFAPAAQEREYAIELSGYLIRHPRIQRLQLVVNDGGPGSLPMHRAAPEAKAAEGPAAPTLTLAPLVFERKAAQGDVYVTQRSIKFSGAGHATLAMRWSLAAF